METLYDLKVADVMHNRLWDLPLVEKSAPIKMVLIILTTRGYVWVVDTREDMNIVGVITEHDVLNFLDTLNKELVGEITLRHLIEKVYSRLP